MAGQEISTRNYPKGVIYHEGDPSESMFVIRYGKVHITKTVSGILVTLAELTDGDYFGYMSYFEGGTRRTTAVAETPVLVSEYNREALIAAIASEPELAFSLMRAMSHRLKEAETKTAELIARSRMPKEDAAELSHLYFG